MKAQIVPILITLLCSVMANARSARAAIVMVTNTNDNGPGSLRAALAVANDGDTINASGVSGTILLTSGELQIHHGVTINGPGAESLALNGNAAFRVFENFASNVTISGFTITNGLSDNNGGGGILNHGGLTLSSSSIVGNTGGPHPAFLSGGGGINSNGGGTLTITNSVISSNSAGGFVPNIPAGGGIFFSGGGNLTITNSAISTNFSGSGGGVYSDAGILTVTSTIISNNNTVAINGESSGGGIFFSGGTLTITSSVISGNMAGEGGGIAGGGTMTVSNSTISGNGYSCMGGGISAGGQLTLLNSTINGNSSCVAGGDGIGICGPPSGGSGIASFGTLSVINSTITGNHADCSDQAGGGILNEGNLIVTNSTISDNTAANPGGAIYNASTTNIGDTVLNAGASGGTIFNDGGTVTSLGYNLASDDGGGVLVGPGDQINTDPMLSPLQDNGGPTLTHALLLGSPAINAGDPSFTPPPFYDQRGVGFDRVVNGRIDIGSFEVQGPRTSPTPRPRPTAYPRLLRNDSR